MSLTTSRRYLAFGSCGDDHAKQYLIGASRRQVRLGYRLLTAVDFHPGRPYIRRLMRLRDVTRDPTSGILTPDNQAEWRAVLRAAGVHAAPPTGIWHPRNPESRMPGRHRDSH